MPCQPKGWKKNSSNVVNGDFLVRENCRGVEGIKNIEAMEEREE